MSTASGMPHPISRRVRTRDDIPIHLLGGFAPLGRSLRACMTVFLSTHFTENYSLFEFARGFWFRFAADARGRKGFWKTGKLATWGFANHLLRRSRQYLSQTRKTAKKPGFRRNEEPRLRRLEKNSHQRPTLRIRSIGKVFQFELMRSSVDSHAANLSMLQVPHAMQRGAPTCEAPRSIQLAASWEPPGEAPSLPRYFSALAAWYSSTIFCAICAGHSS